MDYSANIDGAKAYGYELNISRRHAVEVCRAVRGMNLEKAKKFLEDVIDKKRFVEFKKHNKQIPHRTGGKPGRYPVKAAKTILKLLENAENNAEERGMGDNLVVRHIAAHKGRTYKRLASKGRWKQSDMETTNIEVVLTES
ncbi:MAG: 50S ribosomal protein L22 [Candidatus Diapherotrites archaeon]|nr:50S ribosomal protein L22 [Candidatus Diapherotrites archaeon]